MNAPASIPTGHPVTIPPVALRVTGRRVVVHPASLDDRLADLAEALCGTSADARSPVVVDGRPWPPATTLVAAGVRQGSTVAVGSLNGASRAAVSGASSEQALVEVRAVAGPDAGRCWPLPGGRHVLGSSPGTEVWIEDPGIEPHHLLLDVYADGQVVASQLCGHVPVRVGTAPLRRTPLGPGAVLHLGATVVEIVAMSPESRLVPLAASLPDRPGGSDDIGSDPWRRTHHRGPRTDLSEPLRPIHLPTGDSTEDRDGHTPMAAPVAPALISLGVCVLLATVLGRPEMVWFGMLAVVSAFAMWGHQHLRRWRSRRRRSARSAAVAEDLARQVTEAHRRAVAERWRVHPELHEVLARVRRHDPQLWMRRPADSGRPSGHGAPANTDHTDTPWNVVLGRGDLPWQPPLAEGQKMPADRSANPADLLAAAAPPSTLPDVPVPVNLGPGAVLGVTGRHREALVRSLVLQLAAHVGPADVAVLVVTPPPKNEHPPEPWSWCEWLPHTHAVATPADVADLAPTLQADQRHLLVVVTDETMLEQRTGPVRRLLAALTSPPAVVVLAAATPPTWCTHRITLTAAGPGRLDGAAGGHLAPPVVFRPAGLRHEEAADAATALAGLRDPEHGAPADRLAGTVTLAALLPDLDATTLAARWSQPDPAPATPLGLAVDGVVEIDLARDGPHALVAGTTGAGKSELLRTLVCGLALGSSPEHLAFVLVDYKGGSAFDVCAALPHVAGVVTDLDDHLGGRVLLGLEAELRRRERLLRDAGVTDLTEHRRLEHRRLGHPTLARLVVVVDEFATLAAELPDFLGALVGVAQRGRSLGVHLVLATQRPGGVVRDDVRANTNLRLALRVQDTGDALDVVGDPAPAAFPRRCPGRAMVRLGPDETVIFQVAAVSVPAAAADRPRLRVEYHTIDRPPGVTCVAATDGAKSPDVPTELDKMVKLARHTAQNLGLVPPSPPWLPALPERLCADDVVDTIEPGSPPALGVLDDPEHQRLRPLRWTAEGHLIVVGGRRSGVTSTLVTAASVLAEEHAVERVHVYAIDTRGDPALGRLTVLPHLGGVVGLAEHERLARLLDHLVDELDRRSTASQAPVNRTLLLVDGLAALRSVLDDRLELAASFDRLATEGPANGIVLAVGAERTGSVPASLAASAECRWMHRQSDPAEAANLIARGLPVDAPPGRLVDTMSGLVGQVVDPDECPRPPTRSSTRSSRRSSGRARGSTSRPPSIGMLPTRVHALPAVSTVAPDGVMHLPIAVGYRQLTPLALDVPAGDHVLVVGPARSGRSSALETLGHAWGNVHPAGLVVRLGGRSGDLLDHLALLSDVARDDRPVAVLADEAELIDDVDGMLAALVAARHRHLTVFAAARPDALRAAFGHWSTTVRRSRVGIVLGPAGDLDGDLLGTVLPRAWPLRPRPGLGWLVQHGGADLGQLVLPPTPSPTPHVASSTPSVM